MSAREGLKAAALLVNMLCITWAGATIAEALTRDDVAAGHVITGVCAALLAGLLTAWLSMETAP